MTQRRRIVIIANPTSGRGRGARTAESVAGELRKGGVDVEVFLTRAQGDAQRLAEEAVRPEGPKVDCMTACGGDGTIQEVAHALATLGETPGIRVPAMGLAPAGRCNDFARALGISKDPSRVSKVLLDGHVGPVDLGRVNGRYFCTVLTVGADAEVSNFVDSMRMPLRGTLAYLYGSLRVLARYRPLHLRLEGDFGVIDRPLFVASTANTPYYGGRIRIAPGAAHTDGLLDLCLIEAVSKRRIVTLLPIVLLGRHGSQPEVTFIRTQGLLIQSSLPAQLWADGERIGTTPAQVQVKKAAIQVIQPGDGPN